MPEALDSRPPLGALAVIAVGLLATVVAALLSTDKPIGAAAVEWVEREPLPDSKAAAIPGGGEVRLLDGGIRATDPNAGNYRIYRVAAVLAIDAGAAVGQGQVRCRIRVPTRTIVAHTPERRASYPVPSQPGTLHEQPIPERVLIKFNSRGTDLASVELADVFPQLTATPGVTASWAEFRVGRQEWIWGLPSGRPIEPIRLGFASIWRTTATPAAKVACTVITAGGSTNVRTAGSF